MQQTANSGQLTDGGQLLVGSAGGHVSLNLKNTQFLTFVPFVIMHPFSAVRGRGPVEYSKASYYDVDEDKNMGPNYWNRQRQGYAKHWDHGKGKPRWDVDPERDQKGRQHWDHDDRDTDPEAWDGLSHAGLRSKGGKSADNARKHREPVDVDKKRGTWNDDIDNIEVRVLVSALSLTH